MTALYLVDVVGSGASVFDMWRLPMALQVDPSTVVLAMDTNRPNGKKSPQMKALVVSPAQNNLGGTGIRLIKTAATPAALVTALKTTAPSGAERNIINGFTDANGYTRVSTASWFVAIQGLIDQIRVDSTGIRSQDLEATILAAA